MSLRSASSAALAAGLLLCACGGSKQRPDVVLIVVDTLRADRLSAYGYPRPTSPFPGRGPRSASAAACQPAGSTGCVASAGSVCAKSACSL